MGGQTWLITGASGQLGGHILAQLHEDKEVADVVALAGQGQVLPGRASVRRVALQDHTALEALVREVRPQVILHVGALTAVRAAYEQPERAVQVNVGGTRVLAETGADCGARFVFTSTDMVFDGESAPYTESDPPTTLSVYGRSKVAAERILADLPRALTVRLPLMYGLPRTDRPTTFAKQLATIRAGEPLRLFTDEFRTPLSLHEAARVVIGLAKREVSGLLHAGGPERLSRYELVERAAQLLGLQNARLEGVSCLEFESPEPRPADLSLDSSELIGRFPELVPQGMRLRDLEAAPE